MNPKSLVQQLIAALDADKTMLQPYKNYALSDAKRLQALIEYQPAPKPSVPTQPISTTSGCSCSPGMKPAAHCPVHGLALP